MSGMHAGSTEKIGTLEAFLRVEGMYVAPRFVDEYMREVERKEGALGIQVAMVVVAIVSAVLLLAFVYNANSNLPVPFREICTIIVGVGVPLALLVHFWPRWRVADLSGNLKYYRGDDGAEVEIPETIVRRAQAVQKNFPGIAIFAVARGPDPLMYGQLEGEEAECFAIWDGDTVLK